MILVNTIDLSNPKPNGSDIYQAIYSSQLYGTFFMVFAKFNTKAVSKGYEIQSITLRLMNYKGPINIGISRARFFSPMGKKSGVLKIEVEALSGNNNMDFTNVKIRANSKCDITNYIEVERSVKELSHPLTNQVFDEEFFYREGFKKTGGNFVIKEFKRGAKTRPFNNYDNDTVTGGQGGILCPRSRNRVVK